MRMAITDRQGNDSSPLELHIEKTGFDRVPPVGTMVCAIGPGGWKYIGPVVAANEATGVYTIEPAPTLIRPFMRSTTGDES